MVRGAPSEGERRKIGEGSNDSKAAFDGFVDHGSDRVVEFHGGCGLYPTQWRRKVLRRMDYGQ
jgi:hypothetical protein